MQALPSATEHAMPRRTKATAYHRQGNDPQFDLWTELYRIAGVDLTDTPELIQPPRKLSLPRSARMESAAVWRARHAPGPFAAPSHYTPPKS